MSSFSRFLQTNVVTKTILYWYLRLLFSTYQLEVADMAGDGLSINARQGIFYLWQEHAISGLYFLHHQNVYGHLISDETVDGCLAGFVARRLGMHVMYSTGKISFIKHAVEVLDMNKRMFIIGDGTNGPSHELQRAVPYMCARSGVPLIYLECRASAAIAFAKRWDLLKLPLPFSTITVTIHPPRSYVFDEQHEVVEVIGKK
ncbi:MAG: hypothetical protein QG604_379 [Candidatus Dependentiae bacterium]|nr:hypothetical protein [Candidatus Dependentiae bacterium]